MTEIQVFESATGVLIDTVTVTPHAESTYATGAARPVLETLAEQYAARGITIEVDQIGERLDGWTDGTVELFVPDYVDPDMPVVPNVLGDLREAMSTEGAGNAEKLALYWTAGKGAGRIRWGSNGDYMRCVRQLSRHVSDAKGLCNVYHQRAVGAPPGKGH